MSTPAITFAVAWFWILLSITLLGFFRMLWARRELDEDWQPMAKFGGALQAYTRTRGDDKNAYATMVALADRMREQTGAGRTPGASDPFDQLPSLPATMAREAAHDEPGREALTALRGRIHGYEALLQSEMKKLRKGAASPGQWFLAGVRGLALVPHGLVLGGDIAARARRRDLEADPRFEQAVWILLAILAGITVLLIAWLAMSAAGR